MMPLKEWIFLAGILANTGGAMLIAFWVPRPIQQAHVRGLDRLMDRARSLFLLASQALAADERSIAEEYLVRIRRIEDRWRFGRSPSYRFAFACQCIAAGTLAGFAIKAVCWIFIIPPSGTPLENTVRFISFTTDGLIKCPLCFSMLYLFVPFISAVSGVFDLRGRPSLLSDCGDRLAQMLKAGRSVAAVQKAVPNLDGLTPREILGLGLRFTRAQLARARRDLARLLHPDLHAAASPSERTAYERAMQRVNWAHDALVAEAFA